MEISEILFNELAFFKLMQDLDNNSSTAMAAKHKNKRKADQPNNTKHRSEVGVVFLLMYKSLTVRER